MTEEATKNSPARLIELGEIVGTHGVAGLLRLRPYSDAIAALAALHDVFLVPRRPPGRPKEAQAASPRPAEARPIRLLSAKAHGRAVLLRFPDVDTIEAATPFVGSVIAVDEADLPAPEPGEIYAYRLPGLEVMTSDGRHIGRVDETFDTGSSEVLVVRDNDREYLVPMIAEVVRAIDLESGRITIEPLAGLLD